MKISGGSPLTEMGGRKGEGPALFWMFCRGSPVVSYATALEAYSGHSWVRSAPQSSVPRQIPDYANELT